MVLPSEGEAPAAHRPGIRHAPSGGHAAKEQRGPSVNAPIDEQPAPLDPAEGGDLTTVDRYTVDKAVYYPRALLHMHGEGQVIGLGQNLAAWALASAWRGMTLYPLHGAVVVTGRTPEGKRPHRTTTLPSRPAR
ncbi:hypothetical protein ACFYZB_34300 [Streptomyces sp. NPDC001852]|uniref:hypothetical protein n=1 Tax=Streptomyces sp. NPDC001852 TaxID=3364619 RepID=UPI0036AC4787